jgi:hypothetical protein
MGQKISIDDAPQWIKRLGEEQHKAALRGVRSAGLRMVSHIQNVVIPGETRVPVDRGIYRGAWRAKNVPDGSLVHNDSPHGGFIEDGVRGENVKIGRAMIDALVEWVRRHGLVRDVPKAGREAAARGVAFAIARDMKRRGIFGGSGLKILAKARTKAREFIEQEVTAELRKMKV